MKCLLLALFSAGYALGIVRRRDEWPDTLGRVNAIMGWVIVALTLLVNTPVLVAVDLNRDEILEYVLIGELEFNVSRR